MNNEILPDPKWFLVAVLLYSLLVASVCGAEPDLDKWADAIFKAENSVNHPYGIMLSGCTKDTPEFCRKACKQTVFNTLVKYRKERCKDGEPDIDCLARRYAPIGAENDPTGLNKNWKKNVLLFLGKEND